MTSDELVALVSAMSRAGTQLRWDSPIVVDKHCIGGIPGNRTSMIVVPIVAAHGHTLPKTSSRAITSPAGTADTMEVLARVDVGIEEVKEVVSACNGCLVWGGHVNLSPADDILISVERPLSLDTREQMVASIMSKKLAAGSTHLLIDLPVGPASKLTNAMEAMRLRKLFEFVGDHFGISVEVITTDGRQPIGHGIGPVDPGWRLAGTPPVALVITRFAPGNARITVRRLCCAPGTARQRCSTQANAEIIDAQGPSTCRSDLGTSTFDVVASTDGTVSGIDWLQLNRLARTAARPSTKALASDCSRKSATASNRENRSIAFTHSTPESGLAARRPRKIPATQSRASNMLPAR
jgi:thymidine phosphorylase